MQHALFMQSKSYTTAANAPNMCAIAPEACWRGRERNLSWSCMQTRPGAACQTYPSAACAPLMGSAGPLMRMRGTSEFWMAPTQRSLLCTLSVMYWMSLHAEKDSHQAVSSSSMDSNAKVSQSACICNDAVVLDLVFVNT